MEETENRTQEDGEHGRLRTDMHLGRKANRETDSSD